MRAVNLLPRQATADEKLGLDRGVVVGIAVTVFVAAMLAGGFFLEKANAAGAKRRLAVAQAEFARVQSQQPSGPAPVMLQVPVVLSQQEPWHVALRAALASRVAWDVVLRQLEFVVPDRITLTTVTVGGSGSTAGATSGTVTLGGYAFSSADLATFLSTLSRVPKISQVALVSSTTNSGSKVQNFQITAQMALPAAPSAPSATGTTTTTGG